MNSPKQKAIELVDKFYQDSPEHFGSSKAMTYAIKMALICVDEILDVLKNIEFSYTDTSFEYELNNWKDIKKEMELL